MIKALTILFCCLFVSSATEVRGSDWPSIEVLPSNGGAITSVRVKRDKENVLISGSVRKFSGYSAHSGNHIDIQFINEKGTVIAETIERIHFRKGPQAGNSRAYYHFATTLPASLMASAKIIRLKYYTNLHTFHKSK